MRTDDQPCFFQQLGAVGGEPGLAAGLHGGRVDPRRLDRGGGGTPLEDPGVRAVLDQLVDGGLERLGERGALPEGEADVEAVVLTEEGGLLRGL
ncbi:hypothetical protein ACFT7S_00145 [Streptomyces sp. NPDC057136]|uniref:hypothetical protein n=1 Tax=Streptomyces sp. NPDC057136 TaxID=3346029 RepID=UPI00362B1B26